VNDDARSGARRVELAPRWVQITDRDALPEAELFARIARVAALPEATRRGFAVQLRDPELRGRELVALGERLRASTRAIGAALIVNDRLDLALFLGADGVHLGRRSVAIDDARGLLGGVVPWISVACHAVDDAIFAGERGADAVLVSPVYASPGKGSGVGAELVRASAEGLRQRGLGHVRVIALGGVAPSNAAACFAAGAAGVAGIRADLRSVLEDGAAPGSSTVT
jgi:thiamine-phosphate pyrophosphorylase